MVKALIILYIFGWTGSRAGMDAVEKMFYPCRESNFDTKCNPVDVTSSFSGDYDKNISVYPKNGADSSEALAPVY
jgi:hypothetical protein